MECSSSSHPRLRSYRLFSSSFCFAVQVWLEQQENPLVAFSPSINSCAKEAAQKRAAKTAKLHQLRPHAVLQVAE